MNWKHFRSIPWVDRRAWFVARVPVGGSLLDLGSSDGETLGHMAELRPDLQLHAVDWEGQPERYPPGCRFQRADLERDRLPWADGTMDGVTCMHLVEHLRTLDMLFAEIARLLRPGGEVYLETPHPKTVLYSSPPGRAAGTYTMNFYDDLTHVRPVTVGGLAKHATRVGLEVLQTGLSRNWLFALAYPFYVLMPASRQKFTAWGHWRGWSAYLVARRTR